MKESKEQKELALGGKNLILLAIGFAVIVLGFVLMFGSPSGTEFNPDIFSFRRITLAPIVCFAGFLFIIVAILWKPKETTTGEVEKIVKVKKGEGNYLK